MLKEHDTEDQTAGLGGDADDSVEGAGAGSAAGPESQPSADLKAALEERDRALAAKAESFEKFQRAQADFENLRKRLLREKQEVQEYAAMHIIESLLPIVDDLERAIETPGLDADFKKGLQLIYQRMIDVFTRAGMKPIDEEGTFNPHLHHAVDRAPAETDEQDQTILEVYQRGYHFKDRLLRPAMVKVAVKD